MYQPKYDPAALHSYKQKENSDLIRGRVCQHFSVHSFILIPYEFPPSRQTCPPQWRRQWWDGRLAGDESSRGPENPVREWGPKAVCPPMSEEKIANKRSNRTDIEPTAKLSGGAQNLDSVLLFWLCWWNLKSGWDRHFGTPQFSKTETLYFCSNHPWKHYKYLQSRLWAGKNISLNINSLSKICLFGKNWIHQNSSVSLGALGAGAVGPNRTSGGTRCSQRGLCRRAETWTRSRPQGRGKTLLLGAVGQNWMRVFLESFQLQVLKKSTY